ncbi:MAG: serine O-acetyltransferase [Candidatus Latescibacteria bacterium]|nr:serine O-acetyltransferase [Candidatus Latescibacterota bacterium]
MRLWNTIGEDLRSAKERDPAARNRLELLLLYPTLHAVWTYRVAHGLWRRGLRFPARLLMSLVRNFTGVEIHPGATIGRRFFIDHGVGVVIGETAEIGDDVLLYQGVTLGGTSLNKGKRHPTLGHHVVVGAGAKVLGPITVGDGARVGASSVVIKDVEPQQVVVGIPARPVDRREDAEIRLRHNLIKDPLQESLKSLEERIRFLESRHREDEQERQDIADFQI